MAGTIGDAYVNIIPKAPGISGQMEDLLEGGASSGGKKAGSKIGSAMLGSLGKVVSVAAVGKIVKDAFSAGGNLEQSFGGLDTLYGEAAASAKEYAVQAAAAGISANTYAEQAVSFGAALKQAYGGDTTKAMEAANTAIMDMADNSAKMGTDITSIQTAYQGFAKQNYTMLDNLKLGYGGTKQEMQRLLTDAQKLSGVKYDINNLGDVYDAIHVIQGELGLTGVAAAEAETTLTGSFGALKASWTNLLAAMTTGEGLGEAMENLGKSVGNVLKNVIRMLGNVVKQLPQLLSGLFSSMGGDLLPAALNIIQGLGDSLATQLPQLLTKGAEMLETIVQGIVTALPQLIQAGIQIIPQILQGIVSAIPQLLTSGSNIISTLINGIVQNLPQIMSTGLEAVLQFVQGIIKQLPQLLAQGIELIGQLAAGAISAIPTLLQMIPDLFKQFSDAFKSVDWPSVGRAIIDGIKSGISSAASSLFNSLKSLATDALNAAKDALKIGSPSKVFANEVGKWIPAGISVGIEDNIPKLTKQIQSMVNSTATNLSRLQTATASINSSPADRQVVINQKIESVPQTPVQLAAATAAYFEQARWVVA